MANAVDRRLYEKLAKRDPREIVSAPFCEYIAEEKCYQVTVWGEQYRVYPHAGKIEAAVSHYRPHEYFYVFLVNYLLADKEALPTGEWISVKDLAGGVTFFRGPHEIPTDRITRRFGNDLEGVKKRCEELGGEPLGLADYSCRFAIIGGVCAALLYWQGDEDFAAEAKILLDKSVAGLALDIIYALLCEICARAGGNEENQATARVIKLRQGPFL